MDHPTEVSSVHGGDRDETATGIEGLSAGLAMYPTQPAGELRRLAHHAERLGYRNLWFGDSQNIWREAFVTMGAAAVGTERITIGAGVSNVETRHASVLASAFVTLSELTGGRVAAGVGTGFTSVRTMGLTPTRLATLEASIEDLRRLWAGDEAVHHVSGSRYRLSYLDRPWSIPVYVAASGPRLLHLAGRIADGVIMLVGTDPATVRQALAQVHDGARQAGRDVDALHVVLWCPAAISDDGDRARDLVRPHVASAVMQKRPMEPPDEEIAVVRLIRETYDYYDHMVVGAPHARLVTDALAVRFSLAGTPQECRRRVTELSGTGIDQISLIPFVEPGQDRSVLFDAFADALPELVLQP